MNSPYPHTSRSRPERLRIFDELQRPQTLPNPAESYARAHIRLDAAPDRQAPHLSDDAPSLILGLGPAPASLLPLLGTGTVFYVENPAFIAQMPTEWQASIPGHWQALTPQDCIPYLCRARLLFYEPNLRLFPRFWGALWAAAQVETQGMTAPHTRAPCVFLAGTAGTLLHRELVFSFKELGFHVHEIPHPLSAPLLLRAIETFRPQLFLSVNVCGLDPLGESFFLLRHCGVPLALWLVDNPWHILSALRSSWWQEAHLFCTDASFQAELRAHGAHCETLPLACYPALWTHEPQAEPSIPFLFVGSSRFPDHDRYFAACTPDAALLRAARDVECPDIHWWVKKLDLQQCWPGNAYRQAGFHADSCSLQHKLQWLRPAIPLGLRLHGDAFWRELLPECAFPPVSYYDGLPKLYPAARFTLNIRSYLLPDGLSQRPFDVWCGHGFLLTEASPGFDIFPPELVRPIVLEHPQELSDRAAFFQTHPQQAQDLAHAWRTLLYAEHSYSHRIQTLLHSIHKKNTSAPRQTLDSIPSCE